MLANCGFTVSEDIALQGARLEILTFTCDKNQLSKKMWKCPSNNYCQKFGFMLSELLDL